MSMAMSKGAYGLRWAGAKIKNRASEIVGSANSSP